MRAPLRLLLTLACLVGDLASNLAHASEIELQTYRFGAYGSFQNAGVTVSVYGNGNFTPSQHYSANSTYTGETWPAVLIPESDFFRNSNSVNSRFSDCETLLADRSLVALNFMLQRGAITEEMRALQLRVETELAPDQVTFLHTLRETTNFALIEEYGEIPSHARRGDNSVFEYLSMTDYGESEEQHKAWVDAHPINYVVDAGTMWIINGHTYVDNVFTPRALPFKVGAKAKPLLGDIPSGGRIRNYELGHLTNRKTKVEVMLAHAAMIITSDVIATGGDIEQAYIYGHALDQAHATLYKLRYGLEEIQSDLPQGEAALRIRLVDLLERYPPSELMAHLKKWGEIFNSKREADDPISESELLTRYIEIKNNRTSFYLESPARNSERNTGVRLRDFSNVKAAKVMEGLTEDQRNFVHGDWSGVTPPAENRDKESWMYSDHGSWGGFGRIAVGDQLGPRDLWKKLSGWIEATGIDPSDAKAVSGLYQAIIQDLSAQGLKNPHEILKTHSKGLLIATTKKNPVTPVVGWADQIIPLYTTRQGTWFYQNITRYGGLVHYAMPWDSLRGLSEQTEAPLRFERKSPALLSRNARPY